MNILLLTAGIGISATGIVTKNIINGLEQNGVSIHVLLEGSSKNKETLNNVKVFNINYKKIKDSSFYSELSILLLKYPLNEIGFIRKATQRALYLHNEHNYDFIMVLSSASGLHLLQAGLNIKKKTKLPLYIHATDPIPAPKPWYNTQSLRTALIATAKKVYRKADIISLSNKYMLEYQKQIMKIQDVPSFVAHNPSSNESIFQNIKNEKPKIFLYVGSIYHQRQPDELIKSFINFSHNKDVELWFMGNHKNLDLAKYTLDETKLNKIRLLDFHKDPSNIIEQASVLVDFDANFKDDVFISSKLITYLNTDIPILSLTPKNSPTDNLLPNTIDLGVVKMYYDDNNKEASFARVLSLNTQNSKVIFKNRLTILESFKKENVGKIIVSTLKKRIN